MAAMPIHIDGRDFGGEASCGGDAGDRAGQVSDAVATVVKTVTGTDDPTEAQARLQADPALLSTLQQKLAEIGLEQERLRYEAEAKEREAAGKKRPKIMAAVKVDEIRKSLKKADIDAKFVALLDYLMGKKSALDDFPTLKKIILGE